MPTSVDRHKVQQLLVHGAQIIDVLPPQEYHDLHLPGAISLPLKDLTAVTAADLSTSRPIIVCCYDYQ